MDDDAARERDREGTRWQGGIDARVTNNSRRLDNLNGSIEHIDEGITAMRDQFSREMAAVKEQFQTQIGGLKEEVAVLRTKVALWSAIGALAGGAVVSVVVR